VGLERFHIVEMTHSVTHSLVIGLVKTCVMS